MKKLFFLLSLLVILSSSATHARRSRRRLREWSWTPRRSIGPGVSYRVIYTAQRGETLAIDGRPGGGFWLRVILPDGRTAYALGDEVQTFAVRAGEPEAPSRPGLFASPPLEGARGGLAIVGGISRSRSATARRARSLSRSAAVHRHPSHRHDRRLHRRRAHVRRRADPLRRGLTVNFAPSWALCPFLGIGGGGLTVRPNADSFVLKREDLYLARAGVHLDGPPRPHPRPPRGDQPHALHAERLENAQTYSGGFGVYF